MDILEKFKEKNELEMLPKSIENSIKTKGLDYLKCSCGQPKKIKGNGTLHSYCGNKDCHHMTGKKRPEHSRLMAKYAKEGKFTVLKKPGFINPFLNSIEFKKKRLLNSGNSNTEIMTDGEIIHEYNKLVALASTRSDTLRSKAKTLFNRFKDLYDLQEISEQDIENVDLNTLKNYLKILNSIKSVESGTGIAKKYKRTRLSDFEYNSANQQEIVTKSSYETNYAKFFEKNKIPWEYETLRIRCENGYYIPDFLITLGNKKYILEVKGFLLNEKEYIDKKLRYAAMYGEKNNIDVILTYDARPKDIKSILEKRIELL